VIPSQDYRTVGDDVTPEIDAALTVVGGRVVYARPT
jgi:hypothetical protein